MARYNSVTLFGIVTELPVITRDPETGEARYGLGTLKVIRGGRSASDGKQYAVYASPTIFTKEELFVREMETWKLYDLVYISGMFATTIINKTSTCTTCGQKNREEGSFAYVQPILMRVQQHFRDEDSAVNELKHLLLASNRFVGVGGLGKDPKRVVLKTKIGKQKVVCQYPIVLNRLIYVAADPAEKKNDFPWVKSYGKHCDEDYFRLMKGSSVMIDGFLQTRHVRKHAVCAYCGQEYDWKDTTLEIVPYEVEYLQNFRSQEEADRLQAERKEQSAKDIMERLKKEMGVQKEEDDLIEGEITDEAELIA